MLLVLSWVLGLSDLEKALIDVVVVPDVFAGTVGTPVSNIGFKE